MQDRILKRQFEKEIQANLHEAICQGDVETTKKLISENPELLNVSDLKHDYGRTPLNLALHRGQYPIAEFLITKENVNVPDEGGCTPLHEAAFKGNLPLVKLLVEAGALLNERCRSDYSRTAINIAVNMKHLAIVDYLLTQGADLSIPDLGNSTPLKNIMKIGHFKPLDITSKDEKPDLSNASTDLKSLFYKMTLKTQENEAKKNKNDTSVGKVSQSSIFSPGVIAYRRMLDSFATIYQNSEEVEWDFSKLTSDRRLIGSCVQLPFQLKNAFSLIGQGLQSKNTEENDNALMACKLFDYILKNGFKYGLYKTQLHETLKNLFPNKKDEMENIITQIISGQYPLENLIITIQIGEVLRMNAEENAFRMK